MSIVCYRGDLTPDDHFDRLPDSLLLLIFNSIADVKSLGRCCLVSRRFHSLVPHVHSVVVHVDCVISDDDSSTSASASAAAKSRSHFLSLFRSLFSTLLFKPLHALSHLLLLPRPPSQQPPLNPNPNPNPTHHSPTQVLNNFRHLKSLRIELPTGELGVDDGVLLKWRAQFGSTLDNCVILGASSVTTQSDSDPPNTPDDSGSIPESFYTNGGLKLRVVWTISSLIAASARHYLLQPIIAEHRALDSLVLTDADGQGVLCMDKDHLEELRVKPLSASTASKRTLVPALNMRLWYAPVLELPGGIVLKGATLVAIRPNEDSGVTASKKDVSDVSWIADSFAEPYGAAARMLVKRRTYCLEMNSF